MSIYFIAAIGTDIGKTFFVENICTILNKQKRKVAAIKPIASGFIKEDSNSDSAKILKALDRDISQENINSITPWRFEEAISPHIAAKNIGLEIDFLEVVNFCQAEILRSKKENSFLFIEAAGGIMTPINKDKTFIDLAFELKIPVLLLTANYLGSISHTLCAIEALKNKKIFVEKIIINDFLSNQKNSFISNEEMIKTIENFSKISAILLEDYLTIYKANND